jgi:hypothetical protein
MEQWTEEDIAARFQEAARTLRRLPPVMARGYFSAWPPIIRTVQEILDAEPMPMRLGPPNAAAIARLEETMGWIFLLDSETERRLVWLRAERVRWKQICARIGCKRTTAWQMYKVALLRIATKLNG